MKKNYGVGSMHKRMEEKERRSVLLGTEWTGKPEPRTSVSVDDKVCFHYVTKPCDLGHMTV